ncbi:NAD(P)/FAD-dependent oxidoreductase [Hellea balneolensis]|uniref:NAD(P)/FAD-dependent oxidoreductase n=1 Tax=Hellea balneolensis TaxID=287478 RepID=UPI00138AF668|nr:FAD-dependent oxidoreductase [Hellea balneolensis]
MPKRLDILIVGAGLIGLSTADALLSRGCGVTVIEARSGPARGTSYANSGMIHPSQSRPWNVASPMRSGALRSVHELALTSRTLLQDSLISLGLFKDNPVPGCYKIYPDMMSAREAQKRYDEEGVVSRAVLDAEATLGHPALYFETDLWGNARDYALALEADLKNRGATFIYDAPDLRIRRGHQGVTAQMKGHVFQSDHIVIAAGPQSPELLAALDIDIPMTPLRGFAVNFEKPDMQLPFAPLMDAQSHSAMTVFEDQLRLSGTINQASARPLLQRWCELAPQVMRELKPATEIWSGLRPMSKAGRPYIGGTDVPGLWVNTGHGHMGWTLCAGSGNLITKMIMDDETDERFKLG